MGSGSWWETGTWMHHQPRWHECGHGKWAKSSWADAWEYEHGDGGDAEARAVEPTPKHRRQGEGTTGEPPSGAGAAAGTEASRQLAERAEAITLQAIDAGVQPLTADGDELHVLDANQLDAWVAEHLQQRA